MIEKTLSLISISYSSFLKVEVPRFALRVIEIVEKHNPEELQINEIFEQLVAEQPTIDKLQDKYAAHPLTEELSELRRMRSVYIGSLRQQLRVAISEDKSRVDKDVKLVKASLNKFFANLELCKNDEMFNQKMTQFFKSIDENEELETAYSTLDFTKHLNNLRNVHSSIQEDLGKRLSSISQRPGETTAELKKRMFTAIKNLFKQIDVAQLKHTELDYAPLYDELNQLLIVYRDLINLRVLNNKRKAEKKEEEEGESTETSTTTQLDEPEGRMMHINDAEVDVNEVEESQLAEMEKAVAMSSKTMQPPFDNKNEAL